MKSRKSLLAPAHPGGPGKMAVKRLWRGVMVVLAVLVHAVFCMQTFTMFEFETMEWQGGKILKQLHFVTE